MAPGFRGREATGVSLAAQCPQDRVEDSAGTAHIGSMNPTPQFSSPTGPRGQVPWTQAVTPTVSAPKDASTDEIAVASQYLLAHANGDQHTKDVLMRTAGPMELVAGLTVLACLITDELTGGDQQGVLSAFTRARDASIAEHREDIGIIG